jgi:hypothetical protein
MIEEQFKEIVHKASKETGLEDFDDKNDDPFSPFVWFIENEVCLDGNFTLEHLELIVKTFKIINELTKEMRNELT